VFLDLFFSSLDALFACPPWEAGAKVSWLSSLVHSEGRHQIELLALCTAPAVVLVAIMLISMYKTYEGIAV